MISQTLASLKKSKFRSKFKLIEKDRQYIQNQGIDTIRQHAIDFIKTRIASQYPKNDGKQTPMRGYPVFIAQHATATCCRSCIQKWHGIKKGKVLNDLEIESLVVLVMRCKEVQIIFVIFWCSHRTPSRIVSFPIIRIKNSPSRVNTILPPIFFLIASVSNASSCLKKSMVAKPWQI